MAKIKDIFAREIIDSRGYPTVEAEVYLQSGIKGRASVPSGASTGVLEAIELRDSDQDRFDGRGVLQAVKHVNTIIKDNLVGVDVFDQDLIDTVMIDLDGTNNKSKLGANAILSVSLACAKAAANENDIPLYKYLSRNEKHVMPVPMLNIINGGAHANNNVDIQEFMILPAGSSSMQDAIACAAKIFHELKSVLNKKKLSTNTGDEGGFAPDLKSNREAIEIIIESIEGSGYVPGEDVYIGLDIASSEFYREGLYVLDSLDKKFDSEAFIGYLSDLVKDYPILSIEDGLSEGDWESWELLTQILGETVQLVGDDLFVTNTELLQRGIDTNVANSILIKFNQIGTLTETIEAIQLAQKNKYNVIVSHRSGETEDITIADLSVATNAKQIKTGGFSRSDRMAKYNQLLRIEIELKGESTYAGKSAFKQFL